MSIDPTKRRIFYLSRNFGYPLGGVRIAHHHVRMLRRHGFDAAILLTTNETKQFFEADVPVRMPGVNPRAEDVFVVPEPWNDILKRFASTPARKVVFCQNHYYALHGLAGAKDYSAYGVSSVFCCGDVIATYLKEIIGMARAPVVHNGVDAAVFRPLPKKRQIAYMPRKMAKEAQFIRDTFQRRHPRFARVPWVAIDNMPETEVARILGESDVFLSLSRLEGLGLPPLEAMAAGALVAGFLGDGGREFGTPDNGRWCAAEDWMGCVDALAAILTQLADDPAAAERQRQAGTATANAYSLERMERELLAFWREELAR